MDKKKIVDGLIANALTGWSEKDRAGLMALSDDSLKALDEGAKELEVEEEGEVTLDQYIDSAPAHLKEDLKKKLTVPAPTGTALNAAQQPAANSATEQPATVDQYITNAPAALQGVLRSAFNNHNQQKTELVTKITANKANKLAKVTLEAMDLETLQGIAALSAQPAANASTPPARHNYQGAASAPGFETNSEAEEEALVMPTINFSEEVAKRHTA